MSCNFHLNVFSHSMWSVMCVCVCVCVCVFQRLLRLATRLFARFGFNFQWLPLKCFCFIWSHLHFTMLIIWQSTDTITILFATARAVAFVSLSSHVSVLWYDSRNLAIPCFTYDRLNPSSELDSTFMLVTALINLIILKMIYSINILLSSDHPSGPRCFCCTCLYTCSVTAHCHLTPRYLTRPGNISQFLRAQGANVRIAREGRHIYCKGWNPGKGAYIYIHCK